ncbi:MAG: heavy-metal-associated domain-containing protein [Myxococcota bacterium]|nr:heavy-metal-associated domain-containing protein [Myxococcota bacterium]
MLRKIALASALAFSFSSAAMACPMADAAAYQEAAQKVEAADGAKASFSVEGMSCGDCSNKVTAAIKAIDGVNAVAVDYQNGVAKVSFDADKTNADAILEAIKATGYTAANA